MWVWVWGCVGVYTPSDTRGTMFLTQITSQFGKQRPQPFVQFSPKPFDRGCLSIRISKFVNSSFFDVNYQLLKRQGDHPCIVCNGPRKWPQYMRISRLITATYLFSDMAKG